LYLKSLELHGFKSFPEKKVIRFHDGVTVIVGPNGSGKSNITDAMRWVLGELSSKNIRGSKMEDVVFAGADGKKPMSFAEVSVTFDDSEEPKVLNCGYDEVTVTRRYYRSGDSEYAINNKKARLKDIYELFMNTGIGREGYSIIGQGRIAEIISKKSEERRSAFEESAGISKYRYKKTESEKKLAETTANMERVADIQSELEARVGPLEKEAAKARKYLELYETKKKTDLSLWLYDADVLTENIKKAVADVQLSAHELEMAADSQKQTEDRISRMYEQSHANKEASQRNHEKLTETTAAKARLEGEIRVLENDIRHKETTAAAERTNAENAARDKSAELLALEEAAEGCRKADAAWGEANASAEREEENLNRKTEERNTKIELLDSLFNRQKQTEDTLTDLRVRLNVLKQSVTAQKERRQSIDGDINKYRSEMEEAEAVLEACEKTIADYKMALQELVEAAKAEAEENRGKQEHAAELQNAISRLNADREALTSRITALKRMQEHFDGYNTSIRYVMTESQNGRLQGIHGPVSYLIRVQQQYVIAVETALGSALQNIITEDEAAAKSAIAALKKASMGRATFYPITTIRPLERSRDYDGVETFPGFIGFADTLVDCDDRYRNIIRSQLARTAVFDTLDNASEMARRKGWKIRAVTLDGQLINAGGSFTGGQSKRESGILTRSGQIDTLEAERAELSTKLENAEKAYKEAEKSLAAVEENNRSREEKRSLLSTLMNAEQNHRSEAITKRDFAKDLLDSLIRDTESLDETYKRSSGDIEKLEAEVQRTADLLKEITEKRSTVASERNDLEDEIADIRNTLQEWRIRLAELARDKENLKTKYDETETRIHHLEEQITAGNARIDALANEMKESGELIKAKEEECTKLAAEMEILEKAKAEIIESGDALDAELAALQTKLQQQNAKKELIFTAHSKNEAKADRLQEDYDKLISRLWDDYELSYTAAHEYLREMGGTVVQEGERAPTLARQNALKSEIRALGHVNIAAIDEYTEVSKRYAYIKEQMDDLNASKAELEKILNNIESEMKTIFLDAFAKINQYFGEVFRELFGGGHAEVLLSDPENPLTCGIDINAAPPGKTIKNLNLLSGGEQAFIAIALLFALIKVNPSPFCIFDEIEAALDEANVARVGRYIKKHASQMQIIMISHRRGTMEVADTLYGVTMHQPGVSDLLTADFVNHNEMTEA